MAEIDAPEPQWLYRLVGMLRDYARDEEGHLCIDQTCTEAADALARLQAEIERKDAALAKIREAADDGSAWVGEVAVECVREFIEDTCAAALSTAPTPAESGETRANGWREIASAPRDGTPVDLWFDGYRRTDCFWGVPDHSCGEAGSHCDSDWHRLEPGWVEGPFNEMLDEEDPPTHWRPVPLPPPPAEEPR